MISAYILVERASRFHAFGYTEETQMTYAASEVQIARRLRPLRKSNKIPRVSVEFARRVVMPDNAQNSTQRTVSFV